MTNPYFEDRPFLSVAAVVAKSLTRRHPARDCYRPDDAVVLRSKGDR
jgi:hypothetical protein